MNPLNRVAGTLRLKLVWGTFMVTARGCETPWARNCFQTWTGCLVLLSLYTPADGWEPRLSGIGDCPGLLTTSRAAGISDELPWGK